MQKINRKKVWKLGLSARNLLAGLIPILIGLLLSACEEGVKLARSRIDVEVTVTPQTLTLYEGRLGYLRGELNVAHASSLDWSSSDYSVVDVWANDSDDGTATVKALKPGIARIYASWGNSGSLETTGSCDVTVLPVTARRIDIQPDTLTLAIGGSKPISAFVYDSVGIELLRTLYWRSSDETVASVTRYDLLDLTSVYGRNRGRTYVIASTEALLDSSLVIVE